MWKGTLFDGWSKMVSTLDCGDGSFLKFFPTIIDEMWWKMVWTYCWILSRQPSCFSSEFNPLTTYLCLGKSKKHHIFTYLSIWAWVHTARSHFVYTTLFTTNVASIPYCISPLETKPCSHVLHDSPPPVLAQFTPLFRSIYNSSMGPVHSWASLLLKVTSVKR